MKKGSASPPPITSAARNQPFLGVGGQIASDPPLQLWASWGWCAFSIFLEKGGVVSIDRESIFMG